MTADLSPLDAAFLGRVAARIVNEVREIDRVVYDYTSKPPGTIEWEQRDRTVWGMVRFCCSPGSDRRHVRGLAMDMFNYVMVLASVIMGLGITHLLQGVGRIVQHPGREKAYWVHLLWVAAIFFRAIFWWWFEFRLSTTAEWTFTLYLFVLGYAVLIYLWCALLFPPDLEGYDGFRDYFYSRRRWFFGLLLAGQAVDVADTLLKGLDHFRSLGPSYLVLIAGLSALLLIAMKTRSERFHAAFASFAVAYLIAYPLLVFGTLI